MGSTETVMSSVCALFKKNSNIRHDGILSIGNFMLMINNHFALFQLPGNLLITINVLTIFVVTRNFLFIIIPIIPFFILKNIPKNTPRFCFASFKKVHIKFNACNVTVCFNSESSLNGI
jgi:hypothetical protein